MTKDSTKLNCKEVVPVLRNDLQEEIKIDSKVKDKNIPRQMEDFKNIENLLSNLTLQQYGDKIEEVESNLKTLSLKTDFEDEDEDITLAKVNARETDTEDGDQSCSENNSFSPSTEEEEEKREKSEQHQINTESEIPFGLKDDSDTENVDHKDLMENLKIMELKSVVFDPSGETSEDEDVFDPSGETSEDEDAPDHLLMTRGPVHDHKSQNNRFTNLGLYPQFRQENLYNQACYSCSPLNESADASFLDVKFYPFCGSEMLLQGYGSNSSPPQNVANNDSYSQLSPQSTHSLNSPPHHSNNFAPLNFNQTTFGLQTELSNDNWNPDPSSQFHDFLSNNFAYQPLSPPQSVSPFLKDGHDGSQIGIIEDNEKDDDDLINIIDTLSDTSKTKIPEFELLNLRNVLEGNEGTIRDEMGLYLNDEDTHFQDSCGYPRFSPLSNERNNDELNDNFEQLFNDILHSIVEINPDELDIYLKDENNAYDPSYARNIIYDRCEPNKRDQVLRKLSSLSNEDLCKKDDDGDTCLMIVNSKPEDSPCYYENVFCLQEKVMKIKLCCDIPLARAKRCKVCGNSNSAKFYTLLSHKNKEGDTALSCAIKTNHSDVTVNYILYGILQCDEDFRRVFDERGRAMIADIAQNYSSLKKYL